MFNWSLINNNFTETDRQSIISFLDSCDVRLTQGDKVREFENKWSKWLGVKHSVYVNSGASANLIMFAIAKYITKVSEPEIITPPLGWVSDVAPLVFMDITPVFVDVNMHNMAMNTDKIIDSITDNTIAINLVHLLGFDGLDDKLVNICKEKNILLIEDCCESHGTTHNGQKVGTFGDMSNFSFYFGHHITTVEGGMVCTNDDKLFDYIRMFRSHGMTREASRETQEYYKDNYPDLNPLFTFAVPGFNLRNTELNAVIGISQMDRLDGNITTRVNNLDIWLDTLDPNLFYTEFNREGNSSFALPLILKTSNKKLFDNVCSIIDNNKVEYRKGTAGGGNQAKQPYIEDCQIVTDDLTIVNHIHDFGLYVGNHPELTATQITELTTKLNNV